MVYIQNSEITELEFEELLEKAKNFCLEKIQKTPNPKMDGVSFEFLVYEQMKEAAKGTKFEGSIIQTGKQTFPDIIAKEFFGVEVKLTSDDKWVSTGNSVSEGTRVDNVERIYMFFCKLGGSPDIKYRPYQECLPEVMVTHSPRYKIDMNLPKGKSIFDKIGLEYNLLRKEKYPILTFKNYYRTQLKDGQELWWIDQTLDKNDQPVIRFLNKFDENERNDFVLKSLILFPEVFTKKRNKFERPLAFLLNDYKAVTHNLRDFFTAKGQVVLKIRQKKIKVQRIFEILFKQAGAISGVINSMPEDKLIEHWDSWRTNEDRIKFWKNLLNQNSSMVLHHCKASEIFEAGLNDQII